MAVQVESHAAAIAEELLALLNPDGSFVRIAGETACKDLDALVIILVLGGGWWVDGRRVVDGWRTGVRS